MKKSSALLLFLSLSFFLISAEKALAVVDPLATPNNKFGIHILFDTELKDAAKLVNSNNGDWGYVTIPIQTGDRDLEKWQHFMDVCRENHIIPIIRLATAGDYFNQGSWSVPKDDDILDFANFLNSLSWPTKNRYIVVYNEVNRGDEWGGLPNPEEYAHLLEFSVTAFKNLNSDFFVISSGMDNAAANANNAMNEYTYMRAMDSAVPGIFAKIDGLSSHSYPNPAFSQPPSNRTQMSIYSFKYEQALAEDLGDKKLPVFITETGWVNTAVPEERIADYYKEAFSTVWNDDSIVAVTPFLLRAGSDPFKAFSFFAENGKESKQYDTIKNLPKVKGQPQIELADHNAVLKPAPALPTMNFGKITDGAIERRSIARTLSTAFHWIFKL